MYAVLVLLSAGYVVGVIAVILMVKQASYDIWR
jgi:hypothetical protein